MLNKVQIQEKNISDYYEFISDDLMLEIKKLSENLRGKKIVHINATSQMGGGGVAEILHSLIPKDGFSLVELKKMGIQFCNQNTMDDEGFRVSNKKLADFVGKECIKHGLVKK